MVRARRKKHETLYEFSAHEKKHIVKLKADPNGYIEEPKKILSEMKAFINLYRFLE